MAHTALRLREEVRETILEAAQRLFQRYGYKKTNVEDIAQEAGICRGTVYLYFKSKEEIALSWLERNNRRLRAELERIAGLEETPTGKLRQMLLARVLIRFDFAQPYTQSLDDLLAALRAPLLVHRERNHAEEARIIARVLEEGAALGEFVFNNALSTAALLVLATNSLLPYSLSTRQLGERAEIEAKARGLIYLLLEGLHRRDTGTSVPGHPGKPASLPGQRETESASDIPSISGEEGR